MDIEFRFRRGTSSLWASKNPILGPSEPGTESNTGKFKIGDGVTPWNDLPYFSPDGASGDPIDDHLNDETPHPVYDDGPSFVLLYENAKV